MLKSLPSLLLALLQIAILPAVAEGGRSAKSAYDTFAKLRGASVGITEVFGAKGMDQPMVWRITSRASNGEMTDHFVQNGKLIGSQPSQSRQTSKIPMTKLQWDSTHAFTKAEEAANAAQVGFDSADYSLRGNSTRPYWVIGLNDAAGKKIAEVTVSADSGKITDRNFTGPKPPPQMVNRNAPPPNANTGYAAQNTQPSAAQQAGESLRSGLTRAGSSVKGFLGGLFGGGSSNQTNSGGYNQPTNTPGQTYYYRPGNPNWQQPAGAFGSGR